MRNIAITLIAAYAFASFGCDAILNNGCPDGTERWIEHQLYMGRGGPDGTVVDDSAWEIFLADVVTPRFPDGLTVLDGKGQWRGSEDLIQQESTKVLVIFVPNDHEDAEDLIEEVSDEYKNRFDQESVLKTVTKTCLAF